MLRRRLLMQCGEPTRSVFGVTRQGARMLPKAVFAAWAGVMLQTPHFSSTAELVRRP